MHPFTLPLATAASAALCIAAASGALPASWAFVLKPLTTLLVIAWAFLRGAEVPAQRRRILTGLWLSLAGDVFLLWPKEGFLPGLVSFLLAHLAFIAAFSVPVRFGARPAVFAAYGVVAVLILSQLWGGVPTALRAPVVAYVVCLAGMAAQAAAWWRSAPGSPFARRAAIGGLLFMASDSLLAINKFASPLPMSALWILSTYWLAQLCIAGALPARRS
ncbi:lysoplasmalogenase [Piscinibacter sp. HJYY11]|uniref:lysoplasmalogenase n=1 Tax=Piscinibacter sp. HJYY11 TaxID=2801333 RepID=UPI00191CF8CD|nr:lysoplasmalogenase [Piscinibacter sp. HJYY11]MBL0729347.1 lysoplasmalogenase [Piscinibacter sp. HJYY11]